MSAEMEVPVEEESVAPIDFRVVERHDKSWGEMDTRERGLWTTRLLAYGGPLAFSIIAALHPQPAHARPLEQDPVNQRPGYEIHMGQSELDALRGPGIANDMYDGFDGPDPDDEPGAEKEPDSQATESDPGPSPTPDPGGHVTGEPHSIFFPIAINGDRVSLATPSEEPTEPLHTPTPVIKFTPTPSPSPIPSPSPSPIPTPAPYTVTLDTDALIYHVPDGDSLRHDGGDEPYVYRGHDIPENGEQVFVCVDDPESPDGKGFVEIHDLNDAIDPSEMRPMDPECDKDMAFKAVVQRINTTDEPLKQQVIIEPIRLEGETDFTLHLSSDPENGLKEPKPGTFVEFARGERVMPQEDFSGEMMTLGGIRGEGVRFLGDGMFQFEGHGANSEPMPIPDDGVIRVQYPQAGGNFAVVGEDAVPIRPIGKMPTQDDVRWQEIVYPYVETPAGGEVDMEIEVNVAADHAPRDNDALVVGNGLKDAENQGAGDPNVSNIAIAPDWNDIYYPIEIPDFQNVAGINADELAVYTTYWDETDRRWPLGYGLDRPVVQELRVAAVERGIDLSGKFSADLTLDQYNRLKKLPGANRLREVEKIYNQRIVDAVEVTTPDGYFSLGMGSWYVNTDVSPFMRLYNNEPRTFFVDLFEKARELKPDIKTSARFVNFNVEPEYQGFCYPEEPVCLTSDVIGEYAQAAKLDRIELIATRNVQFGNERIPFERRIEIIKEIYEHLTPGTRILLEGIGLVSYTSGDRYDYSYSLAYHQEILQMYYALLAEGIPVDLEFFADGSGFYPNFVDGPMPRDVRDFDVHGYGLRAEEVFGAVRDALRKGNRIQGNRPRPVTIKQAFPGIERVQQGVLVPRRELLVSPHQGRR